MRLEMHEVHFLQECSQWSLRHFWMSIDKHQNSCRLYHDQTLSIYITCVEEFHTHINEYDLDTTSGDTRIHSKTCTGVQNQPIEPRST
jgi:hypothetical protein